MCQSCVDNGYLLQETYDKIEDFLNKFPQAEFGPAHIVLGDCNIDNHSIYWCIGLAKAILYHDVKYLVDSEEDVKLLEELNWYSGHNHTVDEIEATISFLENLLCVPEEIR